MKIPLITFCGVDYDLALLPHFIKHYYSMGIENLSITLQSLGNQDNIEKATHICQDFGIDPYEIWIGEYTSQEMYERRLHTIKNLNPDWIIHADIDEFHEWPDDPIETLNSTDCNAIQGVFIDRVSHDGSMPDIDFNIDIQKQFPVKCNLMRAWFKSWFDFFPPTGLVKMMAYKPNLDISRGGHISNSNKVKYIIGKDLSTYPDIRTGFRKKDIPYKVHHFKWHKNTIEKLQRRIKIYKKKNYGWWRQSQAFLNYLSSNSGRINIEDLEII